MITRLRRALFQVLFPDDDDGFGPPDPLLADREGWDSKRSTRA
jgi:hypothetical protein